MLPQVGDRLAFPIASKDGDVPHRAPTWTTGEFTPLEIVPDLMTATNQVGVGVHDGLSSLLADKHGFDFLWISSFGLSAARGLPDVGLLDSCDDLSTLAIIKRLTALPIVVDLETGFGDPVKVYHVVRAMARGGASAVCLEDNTLSKRSSLYDGYERKLVSAAEHAGRVRAARLAIADEASSCVVIARTEALVAGRGLAEASDRADEYVAAGAGAVFVQSIDPEARDVMDFCTDWRRRTPVFVTPTRFPTIPKRDLFSGGVSHVIFANHAIRAAHEAIDEVFARLSVAASSAEVEATISPVAVISRQVGQPWVTELERRLSQPAIAAEGPERR